MPSHSRTVACPPTTYLSISICLSIYFSRKVLPPLCYCFGLTDCVFLTQVSISIQTWCVFFLCLSDSPNIISLSRAQHISNCNITTVLATSPSAATATVALISLTQSNKLEKICFSRTYHFSFHIHVNTKIYRPC